MKPAPFGKNRLTRKRRSTATKVRQPSAAARPRKKNRPVIKFFVWMAAKANGKMAINSMAMIFVLETFVDGSVPARSTASGGTNRTDTSGRIEKRTETNAPMSMPINKDIHEIENSTLKGSIPFNRIGTSCCMPIPRNEPTMLPRIPKTKIWMK